MAPNDDADAAGIIIDSLKWLHQNEWVRCYAYVVMPDHIHFVMRLGEKRALADTMRSFGTFTSRGINALRGWSGRFWQHRYYDHALRNEGALARHLQYVAENPVRKRYVSRPDEWPFCCTYPDWSDRPAGQTYLTIPVDPSSGRAQRTAPLR